jgi:pimeloyl-ACP methyl ester carboxylesterase
VVIMPEVELSAGTVEYQDTGGDGPVLVLLHGLTMDSSLWRKVLPDLRDYRCVLPTLPLGGHSRPMRPDADLTLAGMAHLVAEFLDKLDLNDVTLVGNDWGGAQLLVSEQVDDRVGRLVLCACEAFDNYPPGTAVTLLAKAAKIPGFLTLALQSFRSRWLRGLPSAWGGMSKRGVPDEVLDAWFRPVLTQRAIRRDLRKYCVSVPSNRTLLQWAERQRRFDRPVLVVWAIEDRLMPREHGRRLADLFPDGRLVEIADSYTLIPEDQPAELAAALRDFLKDTPTR